LRFLAPVAALSDAQLRAFANVDFVNHVALAAELIDDPERPFVGVGRWVRGSSDPHVAELAVAVVDEYQRRGLGLALVKRLAHLAEQRNVQWFAATVLAENLPVRQALQRVGARQVGFDMGAYAFRISVTACNPLAANPAA
jgi:RimJ/RimL family protein N-acetyltransferase